jgi:hypothetical protein
MGADDSSNSLYAFNKIYKDCIHMLDFATDCGKKIPQGVLDSLKKISCNNKSLLQGNNSNGNSNGGTNGNSLGGGGNGEAVGSQAAIDDSQELIKVYNSLIEIVAPATPMTIEYTIPTVKTLFKWGSLCMPFIRGMWVGCIFFLLGFIITGFKQPLMLNVTNDVVLQLHLLFASGLGSYFYALYAANKYAIDRTFDPKYVSFYFNRIIIGVVAGAILTNLITNPKVPTGADSIISGSLTPTIVAILGGFSSEAVMRILNRLVAMLFALVQGETSNIIESKTQELKAKSDAELIRVKLNAANELLPIYNSLKEKMDTETFSKFKDVMNGLIKVNGGV